MLWIDTQCNVCHSFARSQLALGTRSDCSHMAIAQSMHITQFLHNCKSHCPHRSHTWAVHANKHLQVINYQSVSSDKIIQRALESVPLFGSCKNFWDVPTVAILVKRSVDGYQAIRQSRDESVSGNDHTSRLPNHTVQCACYILYQYHITLIPNYTMPNHTTSRSIPLPCMIYTMPTQHNTLFITIIHIDAGQGSVAANR